MILNSLALLYDCWNWLLPRSRWSTDDDYRAATRVLVFTISLLLFAPIYVPIFLLLSAPLNAAVVLVIGCMLGILIGFLQQGYPWRVCAHAYLGIVWLCFTLLSVLQGGVHAPAGMWFVTLSIVSVITVGVRSALIWHGLSALSIVGMFITEQMGYPCQSELSEDCLHWLWTMGVVGLLSCTYILALGFKNIVERERKKAEQAMLEAAAADRAKSEFLANMSHEIRTPMTAILGFTDIISEEGTGSDLGKEALCTIKRNGEHLLKIISDILDISKIEAGKLTFEFIATDIRKVISDSADMLTPRIVEKGLQLVVNLDQATPRLLLTDPTRLRQILMNLLSNAVKFTLKGEVRVDLSSEQISDQWVLVHLKVTDSGIGMTQAQLGRLFQAFTQADGSTTRQFGGTGLGLVISKRLAEMLGGDIRVTSERDHGTCFHVTLRAEIPGAAIHSPETAELAQSLADATDLSLSGCRVLVADDTLEIGKLVTHVLRKAGAAPTLVNNGVAAVEAVLDQWHEGRPYDVVLMDMQMPGMDGYTATRTLRDEGYKGVVIALTANSMATDRQRCLDAGCDDFLTKPIHRPQMLESVAHWVQTAKSGDADKSAPAEADVVSV